MNLVDLSERKIFITGASSGIGRAAAILLSKLGASLVICGRNEQRLEETKSFMENKEKHITLSFDVRDFDKYEEIFQNAVSDGKKLDGMVCCAGISKATPIRMINQSLVSELMNVNFTSFMCLMDMYIKNKYSGGGSVVAFSSTSAHYPYKCMSVYAASKAAIEAAVQTMSMELMRRNIRVNCIVPGAVDTPMLRSVDEKTWEDTTGRQLLGAGKPEDIANMIAFLLSDASAFITGRSIFVDGGMIG